MASAAPISPELVLVSPELAEQARAELPDRPWEAFLPPFPGRPTPEAAPPMLIAAPAAAEPAALAQPVTAERLLTPPVQAVPARAVPVRSSTVDQAVEHATRSWPNRVASLFPVILLAGFASVVIAGTLPWVGGERPTLGPVPAIHRSPVVTTPKLPGAAPGGAVQTGPRRGLSGPAPSRVAPQ